MEGSAGRQSYADFPPSSQCTSLASQPRMPAIKSSIASCRPDYRNPEQKLFVTSSDCGFDIPPALAVVADTGYVGGRKSCRRWMETSDRCHLSIPQPAE